MQHDKNRQTKQDDKSLRRAINKRDDWQLAKEIQAALDGGKGETRNDIRKYLRDHTPRKFAEFLIAIAASVIE